jgi:hypothetical protein
MAELDPSAVDIREDLAEYFRSQSGWKEMQAEEHAGDERSFSSAAWLHELAEYVLILEPDDPRLLQIAASNDWCLDSGGTFGGETAHHLVGQIGLHGFDVDLDRTLTHFAQACTEDAQRRGREVGTGKPGQDESEL